MNDKSPHTQLPPEILKTLPPAPAELPQDILISYVESFIRRKDFFLDLWHANFAQPLYIIDKPALLRNSHSFKSTFRKLIPNSRFYYAMKSNNCPEIAKILIGDGFGLDVSSGVELRNALALGATDLVFSGPGKTEAELLLAIQNNDKVVVLMDSFGELSKLSRLALSQKTPVRAGVRLSPPLPDSWRKFGVNLKRMREFFEEAAKHNHIKLCGIQFHTSWNMSPERQVKTIQALGAEIAKWPQSLSSSIQFLDIGGGIWPQAGEWLQHGATPIGKLKRLYGIEPNIWNLHHKVDSMPIDGFASELHQAVEQFIFPTVKCTVCLEPGRWMCSTAMHILVSVSDKKDSDLVITDAATNTVGWELFEQHYCPVINLSQPQPIEKKCDVLGSLCTPEDVWAYSFFGSSINEGDVLLLPDTGAYSYSLRQEFIKPLPKLIVAE